MRWLDRLLGIDKLRAKVAGLELENAALRSGTAVVTPDGKIAVAEAPPLMPAQFRPRSTNWYALSRKREAEAWRAMVEEAYPNADK